MATRRFLTAPFLMAAILCVERAALAQWQKGDGGIPDAAAKVLRWLPEETETILVAQSFEFPANQPPGGDFPMDGDLSDSVAQVLRALASSPPSDPDEPDQSPLLGFLSGRKVAFAVHGATDHEGTTVFGGFRYKGCHVVVFDEDLGDSGKRCWSSGPNRGR